MSKKITMKFIAEKAGVSTATVSSVINKSSFVSRELTDRVKRVIKEYNYYMDYTASSLRRSKTKMIGIIVPDISNPVIGKMCSEIESLARDNDYNVLMSNSKRDYSIEDECINELISRNADGIIAITLREDKESYIKFNDHKKPLVIINRRIPDINADFVMINSKNAIIEAIDHLVNLGHKRITFLNRESDLYHSKRRLKGYTEGLKKNNIKTDESLIIKDGGFQMKDGYEDMQKMLEITDRPTGVIAFNDTIAIGAIKAIKDNNFRIPDDFSIIGGDNSEIGDYLDKKLTTITTHADEVAKKAFNLLLLRLNGYEGRPKKIVVDRSLIIRETTGKIKPDK